MRTAIIILCGIMLWAVSLTLAKRFGRPDGTAIADTTLAFITVWLLAALTNLWVGVAHGGYAPREAIPMFIVIFAVPAAIAVIGQKASL